MAEITAKMVGELREMTGLGMMECKKALVEANGDIKAAEEILRIKSGNKASKVAGRTAAEGTVAVSVNGKVGALAEVNCETDFVGKDAGFLAFAKAAAEAIATANPASIEALGEVKTASGETVEELRKAIIAKLGENINVRRFQRFETEGQLATYLHGSKIGVVVDYTGGDEQLGKDIAMHIAASKPVCVSKDQVSSELIESERKIYSAQAAESGKPADIVAKMVEGRIAKYLAEVTLLGQPFVKNPDQTVEKLLAEKGAKVNGFTMYVVGEGIEKKVVDFAAEVAAAAKV
ncbi:translation elongation factor Ts [Chitinimonas koreensis]|uniref:translation elongation factor Ts n=1 Tax=Chitinimonas koreensis TaxID=356302 RepID=UPI000412090A|nr:translation elongation factor Ts [Chitinimonas koreensis]QNM98255.1 elongation factor Ts [Chitinimonas koreensis]